MKTKRIPALQPAKGDWILITCPNYWGKAETLQGARKQLRHAGGNVQGRWRVYSVEPDTFVNEYGQISSRQAPEGHPPVMLAENDPE